MKTEKAKTCFDCLHCKVSAKSTEKIRLCFCAVKEKKQNHKDAFWVDRAVCKYFDDMGA